MTWHLIGFIPYLSDHTQLMMVFLVFKIKSMASLRAWFSDQCSIHSTLDLWEILQDHMAYLITFMLMTLSYTSSFEDMVSCKSKIEACVTDIDSWMIMNKLKMNGDKTEILFFSLSYRPRPALDFHDIVSENVRCSTTAWSIGVVFVILYLRHLMLQLCASFPFFICVISSRSVSSCPLIQPKHLSMPLLHPRLIIAIHSCMVNLNVFCKIEDVF